MNPMTISCIHCVKVITNGNHIVTCSECKTITYHCQDCNEEFFLFSKRLTPCEKCDPALKNAFVIYDRKLFKDSTEREECPICMLPYPLDYSQIFFNACCGQRICTGCNHTQLVQCIKTRCNPVCAFCRMPLKDAMGMELIKNWAEKNNAHAIFNIAQSLFYGGMGFSRNVTKAKDLFLKAGKLGCAEAYFFLGHVYLREQREERDLNKARHFFDRAAMGGLAEARYYLGSLDWNIGEYERAFKHLSIAAASGHEASLKMVTKGFAHGFRGGVVFVTREDYEKALRSYQTFQEESRSEARNEAMAMQDAPLFRYISDLIRSNCDQI